MKPTSFGKPVWPTDLSLEVSEKRQRKQGRENFRANFHITKGTKGGSLLKVGKVGRYEEIKHLQSDWINAFETYFGENGRGQVGLVVVRSSKVANGEQETVAVPSSGSQDTADTQSGLWKMDTFFRLFMSAPATELNFSMKTQTMYWFSI